MCLVMCVYSFDACVVSVGHRKLIVVCDHAKSTSGSQDCQQLCTDHCLGVLTRGGVNDLVIGSCCHYHASGFVVFFSPYVFEVNLSLHSAVQEIIVGLHLRRCKRCLEDSGWLARGLCNACAVISFVTAKSGQAGILIFDIPSGSAFHIMICYHYYKSVNKCK